MKDNGVEFAVVRVYRSTGTVDPNGRAQVDAAKSAGIKYVDGYIFPCYKCGDGAGQVRATVDSLKVSLGKSHNRSAEGMAYRESPPAVNASGAEGLEVGMLWFDIEGTQYWSPSHSDNINFISSMVNEAKNLGVNFGFYTSESQWSPITGGTSDFGSYQLWYAHYDGNPSFGDFKPFGGWSKPAIKQYKGDTTLCSSGVDLNFY